MVRDMTVLRLRWWTVASSRVLMRHWHWFFLAGAVVPMATSLSSLLRFISYPLQQAFEAGHGIAWHFARVAGIQFIAWGWVFVQRRALSGGDFASYLLSLPVTALQRLTVDLSMLAAANTLLLIPVTAALMEASASANSTRGSFLIGLSAIVALSILCQLAVLGRRPMTALPILLGDLWLSWAFAQGPPILCWVLLSASVAAGLWILCRAPSSRPIFPTRSWNPSSASLPWSVLSPAWRIQRKALTSQSASYVRTLALIAVVVGTHVLLADFGFDGRTWPTVAFSLAILGLAHSGWYRTLHDAHASGFSYFKALPLSDRFWRRRDIVFMAVIGAIPACAILGDVLLHRPSQFLAPVSLLLGYWLLLVALRIPVLHGGKQTVLSAVLVAAAWSAIAIAATSQGVR